MARYKYRRRKPVRRTRCPRVGTLVQHDGRIGRVKALLSIQFSVLWQVDGEPLGFIFYHDDWKEVESEEGN